MKASILILTLIFSKAALAGIWDCKVSASSREGRPVGVVWSVMTAGQWVGFPVKNPKCFYVCGEGNQINNPTNLPEVVLQLDGCSVAGPVGSTYFEKDEWKSVACEVPEDTFLIAMCKH